MKGGCYPPVIKHGWKMDLWPMLEMWFSERHQPPFSSGFFQPAMFDDTRGYTFGGWEAGWWFFAYPSEKRKSCSNPPPTKWGSSGDQQYRGSGDPLQVRFDEPKLNESGWISPFFGENPQWILESWWQCKKIILSIDLSILFYVFIILYGHESKPMVPYLGGYSHP